MLFCYIFIHPLHILGQDSRDILYSTQQFVPANQTHMEEYRSQTNIYKLFSSSKFLIQKKTTLKYCAHTPYN